MTASDPTVLFHVGWPKTGTTSLQASLAGWPNLSGLPFDRADGSEAIHRAMLWGPPEPGQLDRHLRSVVTDPALPIIHSDEALVGGVRKWFNDPRPPQEIAASLAATELPARVLFTLRASRPWLRSSYRYAVRSGYSRPYEDFLARVRREHDAGVGPWNRTTVADTYDELFGRDNVALGRFEQLVADPAAFWAAVADRLDLPALTTLGAEPLPRLNETHLGPPALELGLNRWVLTSKVHRRRRPRFLSRAAYQRVSSRYLRRSSDGYFRRAAGEDGLVEDLDRAGAVLSERYGAATFDP